jgi:glycosyltransferase involved in cell wall biosynthesis
VTGLVPLRRVLFLLPTLRGGGAERVIVTLLRHLDRKRFRLALAVVDLSSAAYLDDIPDDVDLIDLQCTRVRYALPRVARLIWSMQPDVVFSTLGHLNLALAMIRPLLPNGTRYVARETALVSAALADGNRWPAVWARAYRWFYRRLDLVICQSRSMRDDLVEHYQFPAKKLVVINNPIDTARVRRMCREGSDADGATSPVQRDAPLRLLAIGRLTWQKGFDLLIDAIAMCERTKPHLTILGEGPLRAEIERMAIHKGLGGRVELVGFQANPYRYFGRADALILSSRYEGFPNVVLEALACGLPVISTPASGVPEIIEGLTGCALASEISAPALAREIEQFVRGPSISMDAVRPYELSAIVHRYEESLA